MTASADHSLRVWDTTRGSHVRQLHTKTAGHREWVSTACFMEDGKVISGGMDGLICVWDKRSARCQTLNTHGGSISQVAVDAQGIGISASYDKTLVVWNFNTLQPLELMRLSNAVMHFAWHNSLAVAGDRGGEITLLDINTQRPVHQAVAQGQRVRRTFAQEDSTN